MTTRYIMRRPRTTAEHRARVADDADRADDVPGVRRRPLPTAHDDLLIAALADRSRRIPTHLRPQ